MPTDFRTLRRRTVLLGYIGPILLVVTFPLVPVLAELEVLNWERVLAAWIITGAIVMAAVMWTSHRLRVELEAAEFRVCPSCQYDLRHLGAEGHCPECGNYYDPELLSRLWL